MADTEWTEDHTEWAVQTKDSPDGEWSRIDTGAQWSTLNARPYTQQEALDIARNSSREARVVHRFVTGWKVL